MTVSKMKSSPSGTVRRKTCILPGLGGFHKSTLQELCGEFMICHAGLRKEEMVDALYKVDQSAAFGLRCSPSPLEPEDLLILCVKARLRFIRAKEEHPEDDNPCFAGLGRDLEFLTRCRCGVTDHPRCRAVPVLKQ